MLLKKDDSIFLLIDVQEKLVPAVLNHEQFIARCEWLLRLANKMSVPVMVSEQYPKGLGHTQKQLQAYFTLDNCIEKVHFSCMQEAHFTHRLQEHHKKQVVIAGIEAHVCVMQSALEMNEAGYEVFVVIDAVSSRYENDLKYGLKRMKQVGIHLITAEMVFFEWVRLAGTPEFKMLSKEFLQ